MNEPCHLNFVAFHRERAQVLNKRYAALSVKWNTILVSVPDHPISPVSPAAAAALVPVATSSLQLVAPRMRALLAVNCPLLAAPDTAVAAMSR